MTTTTVREHTRIDTPVLQPIETCPRDGTPFYAYCGLDWSSRGPLVQTAWRGYWANEFLNGGAPSNFAPTHWMPFPDLPYIRREEFSEDKA